MGIGSMGAFAGTAASASNLVAPNARKYAAETFLEDFPQFTELAPAEPPTDPPTTERRPLAPPHILEMFVGMANAAIQEGRWHETGRWACGLYVAHRTALYLESWAESSPDAASAAGSGASVGSVKSASFGDRSVSYDTRAIEAATERWGALNATAYGQQLASEAQFVGLGGTYAI
ncbi:MAG: DUF4054 domain-containing protein [Clostridiales bacterium]|jgi:hypothetical protein|nr:DUF4054 domain-containing protein [Clostridiales bacterium]